MILSCNSCDRKFVVPDQAITSSGRLVQCGSCGNKWRQFPVNKIKKSQSVTKTSIQKLVSGTRQVQQKIQKPKKAKKSSSRKVREIDLYSPEYLAKKHGIKLAQDEVNSSPKEKKRVTFGFYNSLLLYLVLIIIFSRGLYFFQDPLVQKFPFTEFYIDYFFESIKNMFEIWKNLISNY